MTESSPFSVLLIDDDLDTRRIFALAMEYFEVPFMTVSDAESAFNYLENHSPDIIITDLYLFGMNGFDILNQLRLSKMDQNCRILATTAYHTSKVLMQVMLSGFDGYLPKPLDVQNLVPSLQAFIQ